MILVTVGTHAPFDRLMKEVDRLVGKGKIKNVIAQIGYCNYKPKYIKKHFKFIEYQKMDKLFRKADVVVTHAGIGSTLLAIRYGKPTIVVPRLKKFGEHLTHHQLDVAKELDRDGKVIAVYDIKDLERAIKKSRKMKVRPIKKGHVFEIIKSYLAKIK